MSFDHQAYRQRLVESLERLALPADDQVAWMDETGFPPEELRMDLLHWASLLPSAVEAKTVSAEAATRVEDLADFLTSLFWTLDLAWITSDAAMRTAPEWATAREKAARTLALLAASPPDSARSDAAS